MAAQLVASRVVLSSTELVSWASPAQFFSGLCPAGFTSLSEFWNSRNLEEQVPVHITIPPPPELGSRVTPLGTGFA
jgi:hypothetical protein